MMIAGEDVLCAGEPWFESGLPDADDCAIRSILVRFLQSGAENSNLIMPLRGGGARRHANDAAEPQRSATLTKELKWLAMQLSDDLNRLSENCPPSTFNVQRSAGSSQHARRTDSI